MWKKLNSRLKKMHFLTIHHKSQINVNCPMTDNGITDAFCITNIYKLLQGFFDIIECFI